MLFLAFPLRLWSFPLFVWLRAWSNFFFFALPCSVLVWLTALLRRSIRIFFFALPCSVLVWLTALLRRSIRISIGYTIAFGARRSVYTTPLDNTSAPTSATWRHAFCSKQIKWDSQQEEKLIVFWNTRLTLAGNKKKEELCFERGIVFWQKRRIIIKDADTKGKTAPKHDKINSTGGALSGENWCHGTVW